MIVAERKPVNEVKEMVKKYGKILLTGCGTCVTVCYAGGDKECALLSSALKMSLALDGKKDVEFKKATIERQCEWEYLSELKDMVEWCDCVVSLACAAGIQLFAEQFPEKPVFPGVNTKFIGVPREQGRWTEMCLGCGDCVLGRYATICPVTRCSKGLLNGPCGGARDGKCEVGKEIDCGWHLIYNRLKSLGVLDSMREYVAPKDWSKAPGGGPREVVREDMKL